MKAGGTLQNYIFPGMNSAEIQLRSLSDSLARPWLGYSCSRYFSVVPFLSRERVQLAHFFSSYINCAWQKVKLQLALYMTHGMA